MKNKTFYFWWKIHASATSFSTKNKTVEASKRFTTWRFRACLPVGRAGKSEENRHVLKCKLLHPVCESKVLKYRVRRQKWWQKRWQFGRWEYFT